MPTPSSCAGRPRTGGEAIAVTHDGGVDVSKPLSIPHYFTSFTRMSDGTLVMSAVVAVSPAVKAGLFVSRDGALSFQENDAVPGMRRAGAAGRRPVCGDRQLQPTDMPSARPATSAPPGSRSFASIRSGQSWPACRRTRNARPAAKRWPGTGWDRPVKSGPRRSVPPARRRAAPAERAAPGPEGRRAPAGARGARAAAPAARQEAAAPWRLGRPVRRPRRPSWSPHQSPSLCVDEGASRAAPRNSINF